MKLRTILIILVISLLVIGAAGYYGFTTSEQEQPTPQAPQTATVAKCDVQQTVDAPGELDNTSETQLLMPVDATLSQVSVKAGEHVSAGQVLARVDDRSKAEAQIALKDAREAYDKAANYLKYLQTSQKVPLTQTRFFLEQTRDGWRYDRKTKSFKGPAPEDWIIDAENDLALKKAEFEDAQTTLNQMELKAPFSGVMTEVNATTDQMFHENDVLFKIIASKALEVVGNVTQEDYPLLKVGQSVDVYFDARPDVTVQGKVDRIIPKLIAGDSPTYDIYISLDQVPDGLVDGMTSDATVTIANRQGVLCLPRSVVHASTDNKALLQVWNGSKTETREVTTGLRGDANVEILSGLEEGEQVVVQ
ncbi:MAG TPA: efflux RND transporter periplasmic adaptor subunit [Anaerolineales bacterium]|nr:efflux RND transporter periplasmic adaptor subunit [Anaerolineales bacterium]